MQQLSIVEEVNGWTPPCQCFWIVFAGLLICHQLFLMSYFLCILPWQVGRGGTGSVYRGTWEGQEVCVKVRLGGAAAHCAMVAIIRSSGLLLEHWACVCSVLPASFDFWCIPNLQDLSPPVTAFYVVSWSLSADADHE